MQDLHLRSCNRDGFSFRPCQQKMTKSSSQASPGGAAGFEVVSIRRLQMNRLKITRRSRDGLHLMRSKVHI